MSEKFQAYVLRETSEGVRGSVESFAKDELDAADTLIAVEWSSINYKDALAGTGKGAIAKRLPLIGGIDLAGTVVESESLAPGTPVLVCGGGLGESLHGGYAEFARVPAELVVTLPEGLTTREAMAIGTAGLTAALAFARLEQAGLRPDDGPVAVTGSTGGVGSFAIDLFARRGYEVVALTGAPETAAEYLTAIGASEVLDRRSIEADRRPLHRAHWGAVIDNAGGVLLAQLLKAVRPRGCVASIGLAGGAELQTTVLPFILRGVSLFGINSVDLSVAERSAVWGLLAGELRPAHLARIAAGEVDLAQLHSALEAVFTDKAPGRTVVRIAAE
jgi:acrylyl-CoA reductase (NADPH)